MPNSNERTRKKATAASVGPAATASGLARYKAYSGSSSAELRSEAEEQKLDGKLEERMRKKAEKERAEKERQQAAEALQAQKRAELDTKLEKRRLAVAEKRSEGAPEKELHYSPELKEKVAHKTDKETRREDAAKRAAAERYKRYAGAEVTLTRTVLVHCYRSVISVIHFGRHPHPKRSHLARSHQR